MRWLVLVMLLACNSNNNGINGHETTVRDNLDVDPHEIRPGVFYCSRMSSPKWSAYPCWRKLANCEENRAIAQGNTYNAGKCERTSLVFCYHWRPDVFTEWKMDCKGSREDCDATRKLILSNGEHEVTTCKRPEAHRRRPSQWRMATR